MHTFIVDSGSTKADWLWYRDDTLQDEQSTIGFNPFSSDGEAFINAAQRWLKDWPLFTADLQVFYYGTGCQSEHNRLKTKQLIRMLCPNCERIDVQNDMLGACRACCGDQPGVVAILGTGTNSAVYDGRKIIDQLPSLGYRGGDPASGYDLGKRLLQAYAWRDCSEELRQAIEERFPGGIEQIKKELYEADHPNIFLASFAPYLIKFKSSAAARSIISSAFDDFVLTNLTKYDNPQGWAVSFVGSIAHYFEAELAQALKRKGMHLGKVIRHPGRAIADYIMKRHE